MHTLLFTTILQESTPLDISKGQKTVFYRLPLRFSFQLLHHQVGGFLAGTGRAEDAQTFVVASEHGGTFGSVANEVGQFSTDIADGHQMGHKLFHHTTVGHEVDKGYIANLQQVATEETDDFAHGDVVADDLGHTEEGGLQRGGA